MMHECVILVPPFGSKPGGPSDKKPACYATLKSTKTLKSKTKDKGVSLCYAKKHKRNERQNPLRVKSLKQKCLLRYAQKHKLIEIKTQDKKPKGKKNKRQKSQGETGKYRRNHVMSSSHHECNTCVATYKITESLILGH